MPISNFVYIPPFLYANIIAIPYKAKFKTCKGNTRPVLEYGNIIWGPLFVLDQQQVEKVKGLQVAPAELEALLLQHPWTYPALMWQL